MAGAGCVTALHKGLGQIRPDRGVAGTLGQRAAECRLGVILTFVPEVVSPERHQTVDVTGIGERESFEPGNGIASIDCFSGRVDQLVELGKLPFAKTANRLEFSPNLRRSQLDGV